MSKPQEAAGYRYLGDWTDRYGSSNIEEGLLSAWLAKSGYAPAQISVALYKLRTEADNHSRTLYGNNQAVYNLLRYGVPVKIEAGKVRELTAGRITLFGTLDPVGLLCQGTEEEIREQVRREIELYAPGGGYVLSPGCTLAYDTPFENVRALADAGRRFGLYDGRERLN